MSPFSVFPSQLCRAVETLGQKRAFSGILANVPSMVLLGDRNSVAGLGLAPKRFFVLGHFGTFWARRRRW